MHLQRSEPPPPAPARDPARTAKLLFAAGLVLVTVLSSLLWWLIRHDSDEASPQAGGTPPAGESPTPGGEQTTEPPPTLEAGRFTFEGLVPVHKTDRCETVSYGEVHDWFAKHPCENVSRALFAVSDGDARAAVSVSVVTMPRDKDAKKLKKLTDTSGTGNVTDLVKEGRVQEPGVPDVAGGAYASTAEGETVTIVESAFFGDTKDKALLEEITAQAVEVGAELG